MKNQFFFFFVLFACWSSLQAQTGISVSPPRLYFELNPGQSGTDKLVITNVSQSNTLDLAVSLGDWEYNQMGENMMYPAETLDTSCASWVNVKKEDSYFSLKPGEKKEIEVTVTTPNLLKSTVPVHTSMLYVTQMNPIDDVDSKGANMKVSVRSGIKLFHRTTDPRIKKIEIQNMVFNKQSKKIELYFENNGNVWTDGTIYLDLLNTKTGKKQSLNHMVFYSMPGNKREVIIDLPDDLQPGKYVGTVLIDHGDENSIEVAELSFDYE